MEVPFFVSALLLMSILGAFAEYTDYPDNWLALKRTFGKYADIPRTLEDALDEGWAQEGWNQEGWTDDCTNNDRFYGQRVFDECAPNCEMFVALLYNNHKPDATFAGYQTIYNVAFLTEADKDRLDTISAYVLQRIVFEQKSIIAYVLTVYVESPSKICDASLPSRPSDGKTIDGIFIQNSPCYKDLKTIPIDRNAGRGWRKLGCFPGMGFHNGYKMESLNETNCKKEYPVFGLYVDDKLIGAAIHTLFDPRVGRVISNKLEDLPGDVVRGVIHGPKCVEKLQNILFHFWAIANAKDITCPP